MKLSCIINGITEFWDTEMQVFIATALEIFFWKVYAVVDLSGISYHIIVLEHNTLYEFRCSMTP